MQRAHKNAVAHVGTPCTAVVSLVDLLSIDELEQPRLRDLFRMAGCAPVLLCVSSLWNGGLIS